MNNVLHKELNYVRGRIMDFIHRLSFVTFTHPDWVLSRMIKEAKDYGYNGVEIRVTSGHKHKIGLQTPLHERRRTKTPF